MAGSKLTKADIIDSVYQKTGMDKKDIHGVIDSVLEVIKQGLMDGQVVELRGFGTFEIRLRKGRQKARNPKTGATVSVSSHGVAAFRPGKELKKGVWNITTLNAGSGVGGDDT
ncbi:HU family DNA-binding protein [Gracilinema caldarium]|uniref:Histone family protein DNA-binding protein n=1 Tax=Gracilinema caldarium (strain ATCC 51460 / DSM 7334 / H1) TaxID=744872 RepID=F8F0P6_GRAC1|nr:HU family DNA-binding protein [Gracilinema caldarium]AEJ19753.1 histone family protein DNA-binding protein [Gracilinema caldarium DSM 7334]